MSALARPSCLQVTSLQQEVASHDTHSTAFSDQVSSLQSQLHNSQTEAAASQQQLSSLESQLASSQAQQAQHAQQAERARQEQQAVSQQGKAAEVQVKALQARLDQATQLAASNDTDLAQAKAQVSLLCSCVLFVLALRQSVYCLQKRCRRAEQQQSGVDSGPSRALLICGWMICC